MTRTENSATIAAGESMARAREACGRLAEVAVENAFDGIIPAELPRNFRAEAVLRTAVRTAVDKVEEALPTISDGALNGVVEARLAELGAEALQPFAATTYHSAVEGLPEREAPTDIHELADAALDKTVIAAARKLDRRVARRVGTGRNRARERLLELLPAVRDRLVAHLSTYAWQAVAARVGTELRRRIDVIAGSRAGLPKRSDPVETVFGRGRTEADHPFSRAPSTDVLVGFIQARRPDLIDAKGRVKSLPFWQGLCRFLAERRWLAPESGVEETMQALRSYMDEIAKALVPDPTTIGELYEVSGMPLDVDAWRVAAAPRIRVGAGATPVREIRLIERPADMADSVCEPLDVLAEDVRFGEDPRRIRIVRIAFGYTLSEIMRGDADRWGGALNDEALADIVAEAPHPLMGQAFQNVLPTYLFGERPGKIPSTDDTPRRDEPTPDEPSSNGATENKVFA